MTKVIIIGEEPKTGKKPIEFIKACEADEWGSPMSEPKHCGNIELISKKFTSEFDLMFAYDDDDRGCGVLYLGHFNDGVVE